MGVEQKRSCWTSKTSTESEWSALLPDPRKQRSSFRDLDDCCMVARCDAAEKSV